MFTSQMISKMHMKGNSFGQATIPTLNSSNGIGINGSTARRKLNLQDNTYNNNSINTHSGTSSSAGRYIGK